MRRILVSGAVLGLFAAMAVNAGSASPATDTDAPVFRSFTASATTVDVTTGGKTVTITTRITDATGVNGGNIYARFTRSPSSPPSAVPSSGIEGVEYVIGDSMTRISGTALDGVYQTVLGIPAGTDGTWAIEASVSDILFNRRALAPADLAAAGFPSVITARTTAAPKAPATLKGRTDTSVFVIPGGATILLARVVEWTPASTGGRPLTAIVDSASAACGKLVLTRDVSLRFKDPTVVLPCTVKFRTVNGAGYSPQSSVTFW